MKTLVDTYLYHVGLHLPHSMRDDILKELEANIFDQIQDPNDLNALENLLLELGSPEEVARAYTQVTKAVIDPKYVDLYWSIVRYVLMGLSIAFVVIGTLEIVTGSWSVASMTKALIVALARIWQTGLGAFGIITLIFVGITHAQKNQSTLENETQVGIDLEPAPTWDLKALKALKAKPQSLDLVKTGTAVGEIVGILVGFLILNGIAYGTSGNLFISWFVHDNYNHAQVNAINMPLLLGLMPYINTIFALNLGLQLWLLIKARWQPLLRVAHMVLELLGTGTFLYLWLNPSFIDWQKVQMVVGERTAQVLGTTMHMTTIIVGVIVVIATLFSLFEDVRALIASRNK